MTPPNDATRNRKRPGLLGAETGTLPVVMAVYAEILAIADDPHIRGMTAATVSWAYRATRPTLELAVRVCTQGLHGRSARRRA
jgi:hypothetical protein